MLDMRTPPDRCPHCGSYETHQRTAGTEIDLTIGSMLLATGLTVRLVGKSLPILAPAMLAGAVMGLACGLRLGPLVAGDYVRSAHDYNCRSCGEAFTR